MANRSNHLGEFELVVLLALASHRAGANGRGVYDRLQERTGRDVSVTAVHVTLARLENKGYAASSIDSSQRPAVRVYTLTKRGADQIRRSRGQIEALWAGAKLHPALKGR